MKKSLLVMVLTCSLTVVAVNQAWSQTATMQTAGNWNDATKWVSGNIGNSITENVILQDNIDPSIPHNNFYTIGNLTIGDNNTLKVGTNASSNSSLTVGSATATKNLTTETSVTIYVYGTSTLEVWGDFYAANNLVLNVYRNLIIHGDLILDGDADINSYNGATIDVYGSVVGDSDNDFTVNSGGSVRIRKNITVGTGSHLGGSGSFVINGVCNGPAGFCSDVVLPVELLYFQSEKNSEGIMLTWATVLERNFNFFEVQHSQNGRDYEAMGVVEASGQNRETLQRYQYVDQRPYRGQRYYRLKCVDLDGTFEYSQVVTSFVEGSHTIHISPNPSNGEYTSVCNDYQGSIPVGYKIVNNLGAVLSSGVLYKSCEEITFAQKLSPGIYVMQLTAGSYGTSRKFLVR